MKKVFCLALFILAAASCFCAERMQYKVKSVTGKVTYEIANEEWAPVTNGMELEEGTVVKTGLNSTLIVVLNGKSTTIKPMKKGKLVELISLASAKGEVKIGSKVNKEEIAAESKKSTTAVSTASSRASEAKEELDWDE